jgi:hypothetical protein
MRDEIKIKDRSAGRKGCLIIKFPDGWLDVDGVKTFVKKAIVESIEEGIALRIGIKIKKDLKEK